MRIRQLARAGYTMVEVMMGLAVLTVGAAAVAALIKLNVLGTLDARHITNATSVTQSYVDMLQTDALYWNNRDNSDLTDMQLLGAAADAAANDDGVPGPWVFPADPVYIGATRIDGEPADPAAAPDDTAYCTHMRVTFVSRGRESAPGLLDAGDLFRVELRTFWARSGRPIDDECNLNPNTGFGGPPSMFDNPTVTVTIGGIDRQRAEYGVVYMTTFIRRNTL